MDSKTKAELTELLKKSEDAIQITKCTLRQAVTHLPRIKDRYEKSLDKIYRYRWTPDMLEWDIPKEKFISGIRDLIDKDVYIYTTPLYIKRELQNTEYVLKFYRAFDHKYLFSLLGESLVGFMPKTGAVSESCMVAWSTSNPVPKGQPKWCELASKTIFDEIQFERICASAYVDIDKDSIMLNWLNDPNNKHRWNKWQLQWSLMVNYSSSQVRAQRYGKSIPVKIPNEWKWNRVKGFHQSLFVRNWSQSNKEI